MKQEVYQDIEPFYTPDPLSYLEDWVFHYNSFKNQWSAVPREKYNEYWSNHKHPDVLRSKHLNTLLDILHKSKGDMNIIEDLTKGEIK